MRRKVLPRQSKHQYFALALILCVCASVTAPARAQEKKRIAVMSFDVGADAKANAAKQFGMNDDLGRDLSDMLLAQLAKDGKYSLIERTALDKVIKEQTLSNSDLNDPATAAKIGRIAGVDAIVIAIVTQYGGETKQSDTNVSKVPGLGSLGRLGSLSHKTSEVTVKMNARLVDTSSAAILAVASATGQASKSKADASAANAVYSTKDTTFGTSIIGIATNQAIDSIADQLEKVAPSSIATVAAAAAPAPSGSYSGSVVDVSGNTLIITVGTKAGVKVGDIINITRPGRVIKDENGAVVKVLVEQVGPAKIIEADETSATATYTGTAPVQLKDKAGKTQ